MRKIRLWILSVGAASLLVADGGTLVLRKTAGPFTVSIFSSPEPLRVGPADLSVLVQKTADKSALLDASVNLHLTHSDGQSIQEVLAPATHANAANKLLYAAHVNLPAAGSWRLRASVDAKDSTAEIAGRISVLTPRPPLLAYWPYLAVVPVLTILFAINQWLKRRRGFTNRPGRA